MLAEAQRTQHDDTETAFDAGFDDDVQSEIARPARGTVVNPGKKGGHRLSVPQTIFAQNYVMNGGNGVQAARAAGYASSTMAVKCLSNPSVLAEIKRLSVLNLEAKLPELIARLTAIALDPKTPPALAVDTGMKLLDRAGLKPKSSPLVEIHQSSQHVHLTSDLAQQVIGEVWQARQRRVSDISGGMTDSAPLIDATPAAAVHDPQGGGNSQGPVAGPDPIPPHVSENSSTEETSDD